MTIFFEHARELFACGFFVFYENESGFADNNIEMVIRGWMASGKSRPLVLMGNPANSFGQYLVKQYRHERLLFIGAIYEASVVNALRHYSALYLHGHSVGGTNPSLLEAMAAGCAIAAHDNPFNAAILGEDAAYFSTPEQITAFLDHPMDEALADERKRKNMLKIRTLYSWDKIIGDYEKVLAGCLGGHLYQQAHNNTIAV